MSALKYIYGDFAAIQEGLAPNESDMQGADLGGLIPSRQ
jgi:hypothetical protein